MSVLKNERGPKNRFRSPFVWFHFNQPEKKEEIRKNFSPTDYFNLKKIAKI
jgi:hypothetical protein